MRYMTVCPHTLGKSTARCMLPAHRSPLETTTFANLGRIFQLNTNYQHRNHNAHRALEVLSAEGTEHLLGNHGAAQSPPAAVVRMELSTHRTATNPKTNCSTRDKSHSTPDTTHQSAGTNQAKFTAM